ncbi:glycosyltransferase [Methylobacter sp.]|uniref:glycosyltransferase n=1 Tax=Methylobacter sp. TaxID=2051955 RepID=UPI002FDE43C8
MNINKEKIRVLYVITGEFFSGAERVQDVLALRLPDYDYDVGFACLKRGKFPACRDSTVPLFETPMKSKFDLAPAWEIARIVKRDGYTLLHTHSPRAAMVGQVVGWLTGVPMVHHIHSPTARDTERAWGNLMNSVMERLSLIGVARLIAVSQSLDRYLRQQGWSPHRIATVANGVPTFGPLPIRSVPGPEWIIGCVALFRPRKGIEVLIEALAKLRQAGRPVRLRAVGSFETIEYETAIKALALSLGVNNVIDWVGFTQDVNAEFAKMDVFTLPSLFGEGMPMVILEAMASGVPVVASDVEGISEVLDHGRTGLVVPPGDAESLVGALAGLIDGKYDWSNMREDAYQVQVERFSDRSLAEGVAHVYNGIFDV